MLPSLLLLLAAAEAGPHAEGQRLRVSWDELGSWNDPETGEGLEVCFEEAWVSVSTPGAPFFLLAVGWSRAGVERTRYISGFDNDGDMELLGVEEADEDGVVGVTFRHGLGEGLVLERQERWAEEGWILPARFAFTNVGEGAVEELRLLYAFESDQENHGWWREDRSANDRRDLDGDGAPDWAESVGLRSGWTTGLASCASEGVELGHFSDWGGVRLPDEPLSDSEGEEADDAMGLRQTLGTLAPGETAEATILVVAARSPEGARARALANEGLCEGGSQEVAVEDPARGGCGGGGAGLLLSPLLGFRRRGRR